MNFEERLLMELKAEIGERNERAARGPARSKMRRRLLAGVAAAGIAAAAVVAVPLVTGTESPAYALTQNPDGSLTLQINEFRDPGQVERDLAELGVRADVSYVKPGKWCAPDRGRMAGPSSSVDLADLKSKDPKVKARASKLMEDSPSERAYDLVRNGGVRIYPKEIKPEQTAVMMFTENDDQTSGPEKPRALWQFGFVLIDGPVKPCTVVDDPSWNDIGDPAKNPEAFPPPGS
ncbi:MULTISPECIES: hypothetical protein [Streptosporangium]|uniref:Tat pathway signal sequence domain protein n=1 Tax=Streptosporangium brasiliense TaxID=47480 RepID=A0ABT9R6S7_9ACTN|nr:hypothetical protein [Streptosporangium brasiliense]MDP9864958.1 hypothetical protein [Streptosporangium brasiliense]